MVPSLNCRLGFSSWDSSKNEQPLLANQNARNCMNVTKLELLDYECSRLLKDRANEYIYLVHIEVGLVHWGWHLQFNRMGGNVTFSLAVLSIFLEKFCLQDHIVQDLIKSLPGEFCVCGTHFSIITLSISIHFQTEYVMCKCGGLKQSPRTLANFHQIPQESWVASHISTRRVQWMITTQKSVNKRKLTIEKSRQNRKSVALPCISTLIYTVIISALKRYIHLKSLHMHAPESNTDIHTRK